MAAVVWILFLDPTLGKYGDQPPLTETIPTQAQFGLAVIKALGW